MGHSRAVVPVTYPRDGQIVARHSVYNGPRKHSRKPSN